MPSKRIANTEIEKYSKRALKKWIERLFDVKELKTFLPHGVRHSGSEGIVVDLTVYSSKEMAKINKQYRGKNKPTDVLSFPASEFFWIQGVLGDLVLCGEVLTSQAKEHKHAWKQEADILIVHGLLHLLGFDHEVGEKEAKAMEKMEQKVLDDHAGLVKRSKPAKKSALKKQASKKTKKTVKK